MIKLIEIIFNGLAVGAIYSLIALGFVLIFKSTGILNFAQGELVMFGAFICYGLTVLLKVPYVLAFLITLPLGALLGVIINLLFFKRMVGEPVFSNIMMTVGLASILTSVAGFIWGHDVYALPSPFTNKTVTLGGVILSLGYVYTLVVSILFVILFILFFNRSLLGIAMRGTAEDQNTAGLMGINVKRIFMMTWAIGTVVAGVAGIFLAEQTFVRLAMSHTGIKAMSAAILGGMNSIGGAILGGILVGVVENLSATYLSGMEIGNFRFGDIKDVTAFAVMIIVLMIRPHGIFGTEKIERV